MRSTQPPADATSITPSTSSSVRATLPTTIDTGAPIIDIEGGYELFARSPGAVARIEFAQGRMTVKPAPGIQSGAGAYFVVGSQAVLARAWDYVPSFLLPDDGPAQDLTGALASGGGQTLPGPEPGQVWIEKTIDGSESGVRTLHLVDFDGKESSVSIPVDDPPIGPDGSGYILARDSDGIYDIRPDERTRIFTGDGEIVATGPTGWLIHPCSDNPDCDDVYVDRTDGSQHPLPVHVDSRQPGVISPDGSKAAVIASNIDRDGTNELHLVDLATGTESVVALPPASIFEGPSRGAGMAWSPDNRWLFIAAAQILAVDMATEQAQALPNLPDGMEFFQVAIRPAP